MSRLSGHTPDDPAGTNASDPWAHTAPLPTGPYGYQEAYHPRPYDQDEAYYPQPYDEDPDQPAATRRRMGPVAIVGMICAIVISIGLVGVLLRPVFAGKPTSTAAPNLPGLVDQPPAATVAPQAAPEVPVPTESPAPSAAPTPSRSAQPTPTQAAGNAAVEDAVVAFVNSVRRQARCDPVRNDRRLRAAARLHSADMAAGGFLNQTGSDRSSPADRMRAAGYDAPLSENIARGPDSARNVVTAWLESRDQRQRILDCDARAIGVGVTVAADGTPYWTQDFGR